MTETEQLQALLDLSINSDYFEEDVLDYCKERDIPLVSHSRQYVVTRAFNHGWRPNAVV